MLDVDRRKKDSYRKKYYDFHQNTNFFSLRKLVLSTNCNWSAFYRFVYYGESSLSLEKIIEIDERVKEELSAMKKEIDNFLKERK